MPIPPVHPHKPSDGTPTSARCGRGVMMGDWMNGWLAPHGTRRGGGCKRSCSPAQQIACVQRAITGFRQRAVSFGPPFWPIISSVPPSNMHMEIAAKSASIEHKFVRSEPTERAIDRSTQLRSTRSKGNKKKKAGDLSTSWNR